MTNYWMLVGPRAQVWEGVVNGYVEARDGLRRPLQQLSPGDGVVCYSPHLEAGRSQPCQRFTAVGRIGEDGIFRARRPGGRPVYRRQASFEPAREVPLWTLLDALDFVRDDQGWSRSLQSGLRAISAADFERIRAAMLANDNLDRRAA